MNQYLCEMTPCSSYFMLCWWLANFGMETFLLETDIVLFSGENVNHSRLYVFVWAEEGRFIEGNAAIYSLPHCDPKHPFYLKFYLAKWNRLQSLAGRWCQKPLFLGSGSVVLLQADMVTSISRASTQWHFSLLTEICIIQSKFVKFSLGKPTSVELLFPHI